MANLRGGIKSDRRVSSIVTRLASKRIEVWANTWTRFITVVLYSTGDCEIEVVDNWGYYPKMTKTLFIYLPSNEREALKNINPIFIYKNRDLTPEVIAAELAK